MLNLLKTFETVGNLRMASDDLFINGAATWLEGIGILDLNQVTHIS